MDQGQNGISHKNGVIAKTEPRINLKIM